VPEQPTSDVVADLRATAQTASVANPNRTRLMDLLGWDDRAEVG
jgi:hypothetical protein